MKNKIMFIFILLCLSAGLIGNASAFAGAREIQERMTARLPQVLEMKKMGVVGENNKGFLEVMPGEKADTGVVDEENQDRRVVYEAIAKQSGTTVEAVGARRVLKIANDANSGEWLQDGNGTWYRK